VSSAVRVDTLAQAARPAPSSAVRVAWAAWPQAAPAAWSQVALADTLASVAASSAARVAWPRVERAAAVALAARPAPLSAVRVAWPRPALADTPEPPWAARVETLARVAPAAAPMAEAIRSRQTRALQRSCTARVATAIWARLPQTDQSYPSLCSAPRSCGGDCGDDPRLDEKPTGISWGAIHCDAG